MPEPPFDIQQAHRWFAIELNNVAWKLVEVEGRTAEDTESMIHAAHGACFHWLQVGTPLNHLRGQVLLATVYAASGEAELAVRHAEKSLALSREVGGEKTAFDRATAYGCAARAYALAGRMDAARESYRKALDAAAGFEDDEDREVFDRLYPAPSPISPPGTAG